MKLTPYVEYLLNDAFSELENVTVKNMFGGYGFYLDGKIFGFTLNDDTLVFKANDDTKKKFEERGSQQFIYEGHKNKGPVAMPYWSVPEEIIDDKTELAAWVRESASSSSKKAAKSH